jgi:hypothetical protein
VINPQRSVSIGSLLSIALVHFLYVTVDGDDLRLYAIDATGQEFDFAHITRSDSGVVVDSSGTGGAAGAGAVVAN